MHPLEALTASVLGAVARGSVDAGMLTFLLRRYIATSAADIRETLGPALAAALEQHADERRMARRAAWLTLFVEARTLSDDERLPPAIDALAAQLVDDLSAAPAVDAAGDAIDACLRAGNEGAPRDLVPNTIDRLEELVARSYRPGGGMGGTIIDDMSVAAALLTAYGETGRLPYAMLAEELVQTDRRRMWDDRAGIFAGPQPSPVASLDVNCRAVRVLCRLAVLQQDHDYRTAAVVAADADYRRDAARILAHFDPSTVEAATAARFGIAFAEYLDLQ